MLPQSMMEACLIIISRDFCSSVKHQDNLPCPRPVKIGSGLSTGVFTMPTRPVKFTSYCITQWISKLLESFEIYWARQSFVNVVLFGIKDLQASEMTIKKAQK